MACFSDCADYPDTVGFASDMENTCYFLADVYHLCTSYSVAFGYCDIPTCAQDCTAEDWCYFGSGMVVGCPDLEWQGQGDDAADVRNQCMASLATSSIDTPTTTSNNMSPTGQAAIIGKILTLPSDQNFSSYLNSILLLISTIYFFCILAIIILIILGAVVLILYCIYCARKPRGGDLLGDSTHSETGEALNSFPEDSSRPRLHSDSIERGKEGNINNSNIETTKSSLGSDKLRSLLARSANFLRNKTRKSPKTSTGITGKAGNKYQAVHSPFSILGEEEEDEGFYSEGFEDSPQADTDHMDIRV